METQRIPRPTFNEACTLVFLIVFTLLPALALLVPDTRAAWITFGLLAISFWFPVGKIITLAIQGYKKNDRWEWPRLVGGPSVSWNGAPRQKTL